MIFKGVSLSTKKPIWLALTKIYGIGVSTSKTICKTFNVDLFTTFANVDKEVQIKFNEVLNQYVTQGDLTNQRKTAILDLISIKCNRGIRHYKKFPVRGQSTRNNSISCTRAKKW